MEIDLNLPCIETTARNGGGYGRVYYKGKTRYAHRVAYCEANGIDIDDCPSVIRHACDNPACRQPAHLVGGNQSDNIKDARDRGRRAATSQKVTREVVAELRSLYVKGSHKFGSEALAKKYGLCGKSVWKIVNGVSYGDW